LPSSRDGSGRLAAFARRARSIGRPADRGIRRSGGFGDPALRRVLVDESASVVPQAILVNDRGERFADESCYRDQLPRARTWDGVALEATVERFNRMA